MLLLHVTKKFQTEKKKHTAAVSRKQHRKHEHSAREKEMPSSMRNHPQERPPRENESFKKHTRGNVE